MLLIYGSIKDRCNNKKKNNIFCQKILIVWLKKDHGTLWSGIFCRFGSGICQMCRLRKVPVYHRVDCSPPVISLCYCSALDAMFKYICVLSSWKELKGLSPISLSCFCLVCVVKWKCTTSPQRRRRSAFWVWQICVTKSWFNTRKCVHDGVSWMLPSQNYGPILLFNKVMHFYFSKFKSVLRHHFSWTD